LFSLKIDLKIPPAPKENKYVNFLIFQDLQDEVQRENVNLQKLQAQKQQVQELLDELDEQKAQLEEQLKEVRKKCAEEAQLVKATCICTFIVFPTCCYC
jgi:predicted transcriptional regulator